MLTTSLEKIIRTTKNRFKKLREMEIVTVKDLLLYFPYNWEENESIQHSHQLDTTKKQIITGTLSVLGIKTTKFGKRIIKGEIATEEGVNFELVWFNQFYLVKQFKKGDKVTIAGKPKYSFGQIKFVAPAIELAKTESIQTANIVPKYHENSLLTSRWFSEKIYSLLFYTKFFPESLPEKILDQYDLISRDEAIRQIHFPANKQALIVAKKRLAFEEIYQLQYNFLSRKKSYQQESLQDYQQITLNTELIKKLLTKLPFVLTDHQKIALFEILQDLSKGAPMLRLLEGDVGSGKTIVVFLAVIQAILATDCQIAVMVPTEILAKQHWLSFLELKNNYFKKELESINVELLTGSLKVKEKNKILEGINLGEIKLVIGTHALIQDNVNFKKLALVVIDEQHRFGVEQRDSFKKFSYPHILHLTATPIPRTLALTVYGDQDLSIITQKPANRKDIITKIITPYERSNIYTFCKDQIKNGKQVFIICPLIEDSETLEVKSVTSEYENLTTNIFLKEKVVLLHGKMKAIEKDEIMLAFKNKEFPILLSTSVVEVGIDIPSATVMIIEGAERFGLSQLHQFRGRVGRNADQSYCFLFTDSKQQKTMQRLKALEQTNDGFKLSQIDLDLRGPGEVYGIRQSGLPDLQMADLNDLRLIKDCREAAMMELEMD